MALTDFQIGQIQLNYWEQMACFIGDNKRCKKLHEEHLKNLEVLLHLNLVSFDAYIIMVKDTDAIYVSSLK